MLIDPYPLRHRPLHIAAAEWDLRVRLAACYRVVDLLGWSEVIMNHISVRVPGPEGHFLINPYGLHYEEVTASNLLKIDVEGRKISDSPHPFNPAGFVIHSAIHMSRGNAHAVMHTHTTAGTAVATKEHGLRHDSFYAAQLHGRVAYHEYEGLSLRLGEQERIVASLGDNPLMIMRNHGLLAVGATIAEAFWHMWRLQRACEAQVMTDAMAGANLPVPAAIMQRNVADADSYSRHDVEGKMLDALARKVARRDLSYAE
jgi:ribulose-5-phosphate 4-epimerase/fuculose-1-phosphate aldolase